MRWLWHWCKSEKNIEIWSQHPSRLYLRGEVKNSMKTILPQMRILTRMSLQLMLMFADDFVVVKVRFHWRFFVLFSSGAEVTGELVFDYPISGSILPENSTRELVFDYPISGSIRPENSTRKLVFDCPISGSIRLLYYQRYQALLIFCQHHRK